MKKRILSLALAFMVAIALMPSQIAIAAESTVVTAGQTYYFDLSAQGIAGTVNADLPDSSLKWVPFAYVGEVSAYSRQTSGVSTAGTVTVNNRTLFIAEHNITSSVSWDSLNGAGLIFGKTFIANSATYQLRAPSVGSGSGNPYSSPPMTNEWDTIYEKNNSYIKNYDSTSSWGQDSSSIATDPTLMRVIRGGFNSPYYESPAYSTAVAAGVGFRPVLQANNADLYAVTLHMNGGSIGGSLETVQIVVSADVSSYSAPGKEGITRPAGNSGSYFRWNTQADGTGTDFEPNANVPISVMTLYAKWVPVEKYSLTTGETYYFDLSAETIPGTVNVGQPVWGGSAPGLPDNTLHYVPFTYVGTIDGYNIETPQVVAQEWADANKSDRSLFISDYNITHTVSWGALDAENLIFGREYQSNNILYQLRAASVGTGARGVPTCNEWDRIFEKSDAYFKDDELLSWGQDSASHVPANRVTRGAGPGEGGNASPSEPVFIIGFRPVLQIKSTGLGMDDMEVITVDLGGGSIGPVKDSIKLVVKNGSAYTSPSETGVTRPAEGDYFMWKGSDNNLYAPGTSVPVGVTGLTALFQEEVAPTITTSSLPGGTVDAAYSQTLAAAGDAPITWSIVSGSLPAGLTLSKNVISGTPTVAGTFKFTVKAVNGAGSDTKELTFAVAPVTPVGTAPTIVTASLPAGTAGTSYSQNLAATGDAPITWSVESGNLPAGLTLSSGGIISGTPTASGTFHFTVKAENSEGMDTQAFSIEISAVAPAVFTITATAGKGGSISPSGAVSVNEGGSQAFAILPDANYSIASVTVDGVDQGAISSYTFTGVSGNHTISAAFLYMGGGSREPTYIPRTLTDSNTGITVSGSGICSGAQLTVSPLALHREETCAACEAIRQLMNDDDHTLLLGKELSIPGGFTGTLTLTLPVGAEYDGQMVTILDCKNGVLETITAMVKNGEATFAVTSLSSIAVFGYMPDALVNIPQTGDNSSPWGLVLIGLAAVCAGYAEMKRRKT